MRASTGMLHHSKSNVFVFNALLQSQNRPAIVVWAVNTSVPVRVKLFKKHGNFARGIPKVLKSFMKT